jgi:hypothetical protein
MTEHEDPERLRALRQRLDTDPGPATPTDEMWPAIRSRIEATKMEQLGTDAEPARRRYPWLTPSLLASAAVLVIIGIGLTLRFEGHRGGGTGTITYTYGVDDTAVFVTVLDSAKAYEVESKEMLNDLELRRAMLRPEAVAAIDHDLRVVDSAIAEVQDALKHDPNNPALARLLASSYREKLDVLRRVGNAG